MLFIETFCTFNVQILGRFAFLLFDFGIDDTGIDFDHVLRYVFHLLPFEKFVWVGTFCLVIVLPPGTLVFIVDIDFPGCPMFIFVEIETDEPGGKFARISFRIVNFPFSFEKKVVQWNVSNV